MLYFSNLVEYMAAVKLCTQEGVYFEGTEFKDSDNTINYCLEITGVK